MQVNLLAAAKAYITENDSTLDESAAAGAAYVWEALTGLTPRPAYDAARDLIAADDVMGPVHLLIGEAPQVIGGHLLITVWPDGTGEAAWRLDTNTTWGAPSPLAPAP